MERWLLLFMSILIVVFFGLGFYYYQPKVVKYRKITTEIEKFSQ